MVWAISHFYDSHDDDPMYINCNIWMAKQPYAAAILFLTYAKVTRL